MTEKSKSGTVPAEILLRVLVIDDDRNIRDALSMDLRLLNCVVETAAHGEAALAHMRDGHFDLAFCDLQLENENGIELIPKLLAADSELQIVVLTAFASYETAVHAIKAGATNYLQKPFDPLKARDLVEEAAATRRRARSMSELEQRVQQSMPEIDIGTQSSVMRNILQMAARAAKADVPVLLRGENGTGKGILARILHLQSPRGKEPFVTVNCPSLTDELLNSELFGHIKGSFTGAVRDQPGKVEAADGGSLFLDELGDLSSTIQSKLLRFLQEHRYEWVGDTRTRQADVRIIAATNRNLEAQVADGLFREDLLYRLNVVEITVPPLRERKEDLLPMAREFLKFFANGTDSPVKELSSSAQEILLRYEWPGNVRELRNELQRITVLWPSRLVEPEAFSQRIHQNVNHGPRLGGIHSLVDIEAEHIRKTLSHCNTFEEAARVLGIEASTLWRKRHRLGL